MSDTRIFLGNPLDISLDIALKIAFLGKKIIPSECSQTLDITVVQMAGIEPARCLTTAGF